jgi:hypothetical protein
MIANFLAYGFQFPAGFLGFMRFEKRDGQRKARPKNKTWIELQSGSKFTGGHLVHILFQSVVALA